MQQNTPQELPKMTESIPEILPVAKFEYQLNSPQNEFVITTTEASVGTQVESTNPEEMVGQSGLATQLTIHQTSLTTRGQNEGGTIWPQIVAAICANMGAFALGTVMSWSATAVPSLKMDTEFGEVITDFHTSWISSIIALGALSACLPVGYFVDNFGRRKTMLVTAIPFVFGWVLLYFAQNFSMILTGRFITGMCGGAFTLAAPIFIAETSQPTIRGMLISWFDTMACGGILFQLIVGTYVSWRWQALVCASIPLTVFVILIFVPESPRYLLSKGLMGEASKSLCWLRHISKDSQQLLAEIKELNDSIPRTKETGKGSRIKELWKPTIRKSMFVGFMLSFLQIASGMQATTLYRVEIFQSSQAGLDEYLSSIIVAIVDMMASMGAASVIDRFGRRFLLISSELIMALSLGGLGAFFHVKNVDPLYAKDHLGWLPLTTLVIFVGGYSLGIGCIPYSIVPEMLPQRVRGLGSSILTTSRWAMTFVATRFFKDILNAFGEDGGYWFFSGCCIFGAFFVYFWVPETKGKSLEVIQEDLNKNK